MISEHALSRAYVLFGAHAAGFKREGDYYVVSDRYNSAFMYGRDGLQETSRYDKIHLVPFGEYIPFRESAPFVYRFFRAFSPYDYDYSLTRGTEYTVFTMKDGQEEWRFGVLICYEDTDAYTARRMVVENGKKKVDWLVNISNDGWYVRYDEKDGRIIPSGELSQRTAISVFRAVENRVSIVRSVNTGISCIIDPIGRMHEGFIAGDLPSRVMDREAVAGWFVDRVLVDKRVTVFSRCGKWMDYSSLALALVVLWGSLWQGLFKKTAKNERKLR
jgi:apolipoprotein N-acyltransferase